MDVLGIHSGFSLGQHDASAAIVRDGEIVAVGEEERFSRIKSARGSLPIDSIRSCLKQAKTTMAEIDLVAHPGQSYPDMKVRLRRYLEHYFGACPEIHMVDHHAAHLASAFYCSGYDRAMCISYDAYGEGSSAALGVGVNSSGLQILERRDWRNSLGLFYAAVTSYLGFRVGEDEYKVMGLAAYGRPGIDLSPFLRMVPDGYEVNSEYLQENCLHLVEEEPLYGPKLVHLLGPPRAPGSEITPKHQAIAYAAQRSLEAAAVSLVRHLHGRTGLRKLCLAGGVGLNCSVNWVIQQLPEIDHLFVQPAASDRGLALGCALESAFQAGDRVQPLAHVFQGPAREHHEIEESLRRAGAAYSAVNDPSAVAAAALTKGKIVGWYQGRSEFGPRALGHRSILADPRPPEMKDRVNASVKFREDFRPFAPSVLQDHAAKLFETTGELPYMTVACPVREEWKSRLRAVTHVDGTARIQTVEPIVDPTYHRLIAGFAAMTGVPAVLNTSLNVRGQPIVETPLDALATFAGSGLDMLILGPFVVEKVRS